MKTYATIIRKKIENRLQLQFSTPQIQTIFGITSENTIESRYWEALFHNMSIAEYSKNVLYIIMLYYSEKIARRCAQYETNPEKNIPWFARSIQYKHHIIQVIMADPFVNGAKLNDLVLSFFQETQRVYNGFSRLARLYRFTHTPVQIHADLYMNDLLPKKRTTFRLLDNGRIYYFALNDLAKMILDALTYAYLFFPEPKVCKNPYNNLPFTKSTLYNIYFQMKSVFCVVPRLIQLFFESDFNVYLFKKRNEPTLREAVIREYIENTHVLRLRPDILKMIKLYDPQRKLSIHPMFPAEMLLKGLKQMLVLYLCKRHSTDDLYNDHCDHELRYRMSRFIQDNPTFGKITFRVRSHYIQNFFASPSLTNSFIYDSVIFGATEPATEANNASPALPLPANNANPLNAAASLSKPATIDYGKCIVHPYNQTDLAEFMQNHQYNDNLYNRFIMSGSIIEYDDTPPVFRFAADLLGLSANDAPSRNIPNAPEESSAFSDVATSSSAGYPSQPLQGSIITEFPPPDLAEGISQLHDRVVDENRAGSVYTQEDEEDEESTRDDESQDDIPPPTDSGGYRFSDYVRDHEHSIYTDEDDEHMGSAGYDNDGYDSY
jgi:hypothetical protein